MSNETKTHRDYAVYDSNGDRLELYTGKGAQGKARRHAARLGKGHSACLDRGPNRWAKAVEVEAIVVKTPVKKVETADEIKKKVKENRQAEVIELANIFGAIVPSNPMVATGSISEGNRRHRRTKWNQMPSVKDGTLLNLAAEIHAEDRKDYEIKLADSKLIEGGRFVANVHDGHEFVIGNFEKRGFIQTLSKYGTFPSAAQSFLMWPDNIMIDTFNSVVNHYTKDGMFGSDEDGLKEVVVSTRKNVKTGKPSIFRAVSTKYTTDFDTGHVAEAVHDFCMSNDLADCKVDYSYWPEHTQVRIDVMWQKDVNTESVKNYKYNPQGEGSVFRFGLRILSADMGNCPYIVELVAYRDACDNAQIVTEEKKPLCVKRHIGSAVEIKSMLENAMEKAQELIEPFIRSWGYIEETPVNQAWLWGNKFEDTYVKDEEGNITDELEATACQNAIKWAVKNNKIGKGVSKKILLDILLKGYEAEPVATLDGIVNAITRAAHDSLLDDIARRRLELDGGRLVKVLAKPATQFVRAQA